MRKFYETAPRILEDYYRKIPPSPPDVFLYDNQFRVVLHRYLMEVIKNTIVTLDVGCGGGGDLLKLPVISIGLDLSVTQILRAAELAKKEKRAETKFFIVGDAQHLPIKSSPIDVVVCSEVIEHLPNPKYCLNEISRVLKENGLLFLSSPNAGELYIRFGRKLPRKIRLLMGLLLGYLPKPCLELQVSSGEAHFHILNFPDKIISSLRENQLSVKNMTLTEVRIPLPRLFNRFPFLIRVWWKIDEIISRSLFLSLLFKKHFVIVAQRTH